MARVGVVIVTRDRWDLLADALARLRAAHPDGPVVVVDNASVEPAPEAVRAVPGVEVVRLAADRGPSARNLGVERAGTELVAFCDDDAWWEEGALDRLAARLAAEPRLAGVVGKVVVEPGGRLDPVSAAHEADGRVTGFMATALAVRSAAFLAAGGFHPRFKIGGEEELLAMRLLSAGWELAYEPGAVLHHRPAPGRHATRSKRPIWNARNGLWTAWLRRPPAVAARETVRILRAERQPRALFSALRGLPWVVREREVNPPHVERLFG